MKKLICVAAALGLVAGVATTASAMDFSVKGMYQIEGYYLDNAEGAGFSMLDSYDGGEGEVEPGSDAAWVHTFLMKPTLKVNDKITMKADIRFAKDADFGDSNNDGNVNGDLDWKDGSRGVDIHKIYMEYMSPVGKIRVGRTPAGAWEGAYLNTPGNANRIMWWPSFVSKPWSMCIFTQKVVENDWYDNHTDSDRDLYEAGISYKTKDTKMSLAYDYFNNKTMSDLGATAFDRQRHRIKGYGKMNFADLWVEAEFSYDFGDWQDFDTEIVGTREDVDLDTFAAMVAVGTSFDNLKVSALYFYASGDDDVTVGDDVESALTGPASDGTGDGFNPYYILTGDHTGMLNSDEYADNAQMAAMGVHCIGISADLAVSDKLTLHGALAFAMAAEDEIRYGAGNLTAEFDDDYGWEIDLGAKYKLLDNLTYEVRGAYFAVGDAFGDYKDADVKVEVDEASSLMLLSHHLTMTF